MFYLRGEACAITIMRVLIHTIKYIIHNHQVCVPHWDFSALICMKSVAVIGMLSARAPRLIVAGLNGWITGNGMWGNTMLPQPTGLAPSYLPATSKTNEEAT